jgi:hypothetical protein
MSEWKVGWSNFVKYLKESVSLSIIETDYFALALNEQVRILTFQFCSFHST